MTDTNKYFTLSEIGIFSFNIHGIWQNINNKLRFELGSTQAEAVRLQFYKKFKFS